MRIEIDLNENEHMLWDYTARVGGTVVSSGENYTRESYAVEAAMADATGTWYRG